MEEAAMTPRVQEDSGAAHAVREEFARLGGGRPWFVRHPGVAFAIISAVTGAVWGGLQAYTTTQVSEALTHQQTKAYRDATNGEIGKLKGQIEDVQEDAKAEHNTLRESIRDVGLMNLEQNRYTRQVMEKLAEKRGVDVPDPSPELEDAEDKVKALGNAVILEDK